MKIVLMVLLLGLSTLATAQSKPAKSNVLAKIDGEEQTLDFEAEVIEGQRKAPQLFLQMDMGAPDLDAVMYLRNNFNDFHAVEKMRKPKYRRMVK